VIIKTILQADFAQAILKKMDAVQQSPTLNASRAHFDQEKAQRCFKVAKGSGEGHKQTSE